MNRKQKAQSDKVVEAFFDSILFVKRYRFETPVPVDVAEKRLHGLSSEMHGWLYRKPRYVVTTEFAYDHYKLDIRAKDTQQQYTIAHTIGTLHADLDTTVIEGEVRFGVVYLFLLMLSVLWVFFIFQFVAYSFPMWVVGIAMIVPLFNFFQMIYQRNQLLKKIQLAITPRMSDREFTKPKKRSLSDADRERDDRFTVLDDNHHDDYSRRYSKDDR